MGLDCDAMIALRRKFHTHPEGGFREFRTSKLIRDTLISMGLKPSEIRNCAGTGLIVDIRGTASVQEKEDGKIDNIALRADMDGLPMKENNPHLEYKTQTDYAHMCGHDGHVVTQLSAIKVLISCRDRLPSNKLVRILF
jgi:amidohydrolase